MSTDQRAESSSSPYDDEGAHHGAHVGCQSGLYGRVTPHLRSLTPINRIIDFWKF